jgi:hypothetical protein
MNEKDKYAGLTTIKDELTELTFLIDPSIFICEYIPFGSNHIIAFNDELDSHGAVEGGLLTSLIDKEPRKSTFRVVDQLTSVRVRRFDPNDFIQFEANISYENVGGVQQIEDFGVHVDASGRVVYGCSLLELVGKRDKHSLDNISRVIADLVNDSSRMMTNLLSTYQRRLLDLVYFHEPQNRNKFFILTAKGIDPEMNAQSYVDQAAYHNELNQIVKQLYYSKDLKPGGKCFFGSEGLILISSNLEQYEEILAIIGFFQGIDIFQKNYFSEMFMLWDEVRDARDFVDKSGVDPNAIGEAQVILSRVSAGVVLMTELLQFMQTAVNNITFEFQELQPLNEAQEELSELVQLRDTLKKATTRVEDASLIVKGLKDEIAGVNGLIATLSERQMRQMNEALKDSITSMDEMTRTNERTGVALNVLQVVLSGSIAFSVVALIVGQYQFNPIASLLADSLPFLLFWIGLSVGLFFLTGFGILRFIRRLEEKAEPNLRVALKLGASYTVENFEKYLASKPVKHQRMTTRVGHTVQEYTWDDDDSEKWLGNEANIVFYVDTTNHILLSITVNIDAPKNITLKEASQIMLKELTDRDIIPPNLL